MGELVVAGVVMGLAGTVAMDLWGLLLERLCGIGRPNWAFVGRWVATLRSGRVFHDAIAGVPEVRGEAAIGWAFHYAVGVAYGLIWVLLAGRDWLVAPSFLPLWIFALVTVGAGWFLLHPGMGLGIAQSKSATPWRARGLGLVAHTVFGLGMWGGVLAFIHGAGVA